MSLIETSSSLLPQQGPYRIKVEPFEGPLDLLLHLIKKNELDICEVSLAKIADQYLGYVDSLEELNLELAGDFILISATLMLMKSRALLPEDPTQTEDDEDDLLTPGELVRRLLEYKKYKDAALQLKDKHRLFRTEFPPRGRGKDPIWQELKGQDPGLEVSLFQLVDALKNMLEEAKREKVHQIRPQSISIGERISQIFNRLQRHKDIEFEELFRDVKGPMTQNWIIVTFLSILEMARISLVRIYQGDNFQKIRLQSRFDEEASEENVQRMKKLVEQSQNSFSYGDSQKEKSEENSDGNDGPAN